MPILSEDRLIEESIVLSHRLDRAIERNPDLLKEIPAGAKIVLVSEENPDLVEYGTAVAARAAETGEAVYIVLAEAVLDDTFVDDAVVDTL